MDDFGDQKGPVLAVAAHLVMIDELVTGSWRSYTKRVWGAKVTFHLGLPGEALAICGAG
jgi:hypothetical protein